MQVFLLEQQRGEPIVRAADVVKETAQFYFVQPIGADARYSFGYGVKGSVVRVPKDKFATSAHHAVIRYIARRIVDLENAEAVVAQAKAQIQAARSLLETLEPATAAAAVDPHVTDTGTPSTRD